jgi:hypothetical protein
MPDSTAKAEKLKEQTEDKTEMEVKRENADDKNFFINKPPY